MKQPVMLYLSEYELRALWELVSLADPHLWEDSDEDGPYEQLLIHVGRLGIDATL